MRAAHRQARAALDVRSDPEGHEAWGWRGRTLSQPVTAPHGPAWLRLASSPTGQISHTFWDGSREAENALPVTIPRPRLRHSYDWSDPPWEYRAELYDCEAAHTIATLPILTTAPTLTSAWWAKLRAALADVATVPTRRLTVHQRYLDSSMPQILGTPIRTTVPSWTTAHGDLHWANLYAPELRIIDWEGWGLAPTGYDAAMLHTHSLLMPDTAARIRKELPILNTPAGRFAQLITITELLDTAHGAIPSLAEPLREHAARLLKRPVPPDPHADVA